MLYINKQGVKAEVDKDQRAIMEKNGWKKFDENATESQFEETEDEKVLREDLERIKKDAIDAAAKLQQAGDSDSKIEEAKFVELTDAQFSSLAKEDKRKYVLAKEAFDAANKAANK